MTNDVAKIQDLKYRVCNHKLDEMARLKIMSYFVAATTILLVMVSGSILPNYIGIFQMSFACDRNLFFASQDASLTGTGSIIQTIDITHSGVISPGLPPHAHQVLHRTPQQTEIEIQLDKIQT